MEHYISVNLIFNILEYQLIRLKWYNHYSPEDLPEMSSVSYKLILDDALPKDVAIVAQKQGETPSSICTHMEELRNIIYGKLMN